MIASSSIMPYSTSTSTRTGAGVTETILLEYAKSMASDSDCGHLADCRHGWHEDGAEIEASQRARPLSITRSELTRLPRPDG